MLGAIDTRCDIARVWKCAPRLGGHGHDAVSAVDIDRLSLQRDRRIAMRLEAAKFQLLVEPVGLVGARRPPPSLVRDAQELFTVGELVCPQWIHVQHAGDIGQAARVCQGRLEPGAIG
jgi:hypothetical protein